MGKETSFMRLKKAILELKDGYPEYIFWGKIEYFVKTGISAVNLLVRHGIIEKITTEELNRMTPEQLEKMPQKREDRLNSYRLTAKGVDLAISMINLEHSERILTLTILLIIISLGQFLLIWLQLRTLG